MRALPTEPEVPPRFALEVFAPDESHRPPGRSPLSIVASARYSIRWSGGSAIKANISDKITPSMLREHAETLIESGEMPTLEQLLNAVAASREKYLSEILAARHSGRRSNVKNCGLELVNHFV